MPGFVAVIVTCNGLDGCTSRLSGIWHRTTRDRHPRTATASCSSSEIRECSPITTARTSRSQRSELGPTREQVAGERGDHHRLEFALIPAAGWRGRMKGRSRWWRVPSRCRTHGAERRRATGWVSRNSSPRLIGHAAVHLVELEPVRIGNNTPPELNHHGAKGGLHHRNAHHEVGHAAERSAAITIEARGSHRRFTQRRARHGQLTFPGPCPRSA